MIEEIPNPSKEGPKIMAYTVLVGLFTGFIFLIVLLLVAGDIDEVVSSTAGPVLQIFYNATNNRAGSVCLLMYAPPRNPEDPVADGCSLGSHSSASSSPQQPL